MAYTFSRTGNILIVENTATGEYYAVAQPSLAYKDNNMVNVRLGDTRVISAAIEEISLIDGLVPDESIEGVIVQLFPLMPGNITVATTQLDSPTALIETPGDATVDLDWTNDGDATGSQVQIATNEEFTEGLQTVTIVGTANSTTINDLVNDTEYHWRVRNTAVNFLRSEWAVGTPFTPVSP